MLGILAFVFKDRLPYPVMDHDTATITNCIAFALTGPPTHIGTRILTARILRTRHGERPASADPRVLPKG